MLVKRRTCSEALLEKEGNEENVQIPIITGKWPFQPDRLERQSVPRAEGLNE